MRAYNSTLRGSLDEKRSENLSMQKDVYKAKKRLDLFDFEDPPCVKKNKTLISFPRNKNLPSFDGLFEDYFSKRDKPRINPQKTCDLKSSFFNSKKSKSIFVAEPIK